ncbi:MAG: hypothetical protein JETT_3064 [Candidatus Jettenia ecosi]|uniref:Uncharacterized protein n=1 Tax=Candidatus Jettenia ecosi TaxID=2494326 RepID=A0A533Q7P9_9BACT|nr:MAG: hypothetical protein JETT_3064 [Candidatus Jettenia ecosi]
MIEARKWQNIRKDVAQSYWPKSSSGYGRRVAGKDYLII